MIGRVNNFLKVGEKSQYGFLIKLLYGFALVLLYLTFHYSISPTIDKYKSLDLKQTQLLNTNDLPIKIEMIKNDIENLNLLIGEEGQGVDIGKRRALVEAITSYSNKNNITIKQIVKPEYFEQNKVLVEINQLVLKGSFTELLKFLYYMEERKSLGRIASLSYYMDRDVRTKEESLSLIVYFQYLSEK